MTKRTPLSFIAAVAVLALATVPHAQSRTRVVMLGTGTPNPDPDRYGTSVAVVVDDASYLVDFGVGVVRRAAAGFTAFLTGAVAQAAPGTRPRAVVGYDARHNSDIFAEETAAILTAAGVETFSAVVARRSELLEKLLVARGRLRGVRDDIQALLAVPPRSRPAADTSGRRHCV